jgi:hypothetical protein
MGLLVRPVRRIGPRFGEVAPLRVFRVDKRLPRMPRYCSKTIWGTRELRVTAFDHKGKFRPGILWEHLPDKFAQSYNRRDTAAPIRCSELPKGNDRPWVSIVRVQYQRGRMA